MRTNFKVNSFILLPCAVLALSTPTLVAQGPDTKRQHGQVAADKPTLPEVLALEQRVLMLEMENRRLSNALTSCNAQFTEAMKPFVTDWEQRVTTWRKKVEAVLPGWTVDDRGELVQKESPPK